MEFTVLIKSKAEYNLVNSVDLNKLLAGESAELKEITRYVKVWMLSIRLQSKTEIGGSIKELMNKIQFLFFQVSLVVSKQDMLILAELATSVEKLNHHLLPGWIITLNPFYFKEAYEMVHPFPLLNQCFAMIDHMQPPENKFYLPTKLCSATFKEELAQKNKSSVIKKNKSHAVPVPLLEHVHHYAMYLPRSAVTFLIGRKGQSISSIRHNTTAIIRIYPEADNSSQIYKDNHSSSVPVPLQKVEIVAPNRAELIKAQQLVIKRLSLCVGHGAQMLPGVASMGLWTAPSQSGKKAL